MSAASVVAVGSVEVSLVSTWVRIWSGGVTELASQLGEPCIGAIGPERTEHLDNRGQAFEGGECRIEG